jgi:hypothetical protein
MAGLTEDEPPVAPTPAVIDAFENSIMNATIDTIGSKPVSRTEIADIVAKDQYLRNTTAVKSTSTHIRNIARIPQDQRVNIQVAARKYGLSKWHPDWTGNHNSKYNNIHRIVAIMSFQDACAAFAYRHMAPVASQVQNTDLLTFMYNHYVHYLLKTQCVRELRKPGSLKKNRHSTNAGKRRSRVSLRP